MGAKMYDCLVAAGTTESKEVLSVLKAMKITALACTATDLGSQMLKDCGCDVRVGRLDGERFAHLIEEHRILKVIDATHPFAVEATKHLKAACEKTQTAYVRYVRPSAVYDYDQIIHAADAADAAGKLAKIPGAVLLTTGVNTADVYEKLVPDFHERVYIRVLDTPASAARCAALGISPDHIIAQNPPFLPEENDALISKYHIGVLVTKDSGPDGGVPEKIESARRFHIPVILIDRADESGLKSQSELRAWLQSAGSRVMLAGTNSGCGKTTVTCAILKALCMRGDIVTAFKCGPDYIDPMFHTYITGRPSVNLDSFFCEKDKLCQLMGRRLADSDIGVAEGVMGIFDGIGTSWEASSFDIAVKTQTPVILVVNARGMALSLAALIGGFVAFAREKFGPGGARLIRGVILNQAGKSLYQYLHQMIEDETGIPVIGYMEPQPEAVFESRHLGLVTAAETKALNRKLTKLAKGAEKSIDLERLTMTAQMAPVMALPEAVPDTKAKKKSGPIIQFAPVKPVLAVASDRAFCFYYEDTLELFREIGIQIVTFSPLHNQPVPRKAKGLYLGGGYPELYAKELAGNHVSKGSVRRVCAKGMPVIAECGGFMYLHETLETAEGEKFPMVGVLSGKAAMTGRLGPFGYVDVILQKDGLLGKAGQVIKGHEFHYSVSENPGKDFKIVKPNGKTWKGGFMSERLYAGYPHLYLNSCPDSALFFKRAMIEYGKRA